MLTSVLTQYSTYLVYRIPESGFLMGIPSHSQRELDAVVQEYECASFYNTLGGEGTIGNVIGYGGICSAA